MGRVVGIDLGVPYGEAHIRIDDHVFTPEPELLSIYHLLGDPALQLR